MRIEISILGQRLELSTASLSAPSGAPRHPALHTCSLDPVALMRVRGLLASTGVEVACLTDEQILYELDWRVRERRLFLVRCDRPRLALLVQAEVPEESEPPEVIAPQDPVLVEVEWLDGDPAKVVGGGAIQWVNLPKKAKWVDGTLVTSLDRLGQKPRLRVRFDKPGAHSFKLRMKPGGRNARYTGGEKGRNAHFKYEQGEKAFTTEGDGTKIVDGDMFVTCAGKDTFQVEGEDSKGTKKTSSSLTTRRLIFIERIKMKNASGTGPLSSISRSLGEVVSCYAGHGIHLEELASSSLDHMGNISESEMSTFKNKAHAGHRASAKEPYVISIAHAGHIAIKDSNQPIQKSPVLVGPGRPAVVIPVVTTAGVKRALWKDLGTGDDWFVSAEYRQVGQSATTPIPKTACSPVASTSNPKASTSVSIDVTALPPGEGTISMRVNLVQKMLGGRSFIGTSLVCCASLSYWRDLDADHQHLVIIHEIGHKVGMVPAGTGKSPDKPPHYYEGHGHVGPHCHKGLALKDPFAETDKGGCVMYGAMTGPRAFCSECAPLVNKLDIDAGWRWP